MRLSTVATCCLLVCLSACSSAAKIVNYKLYEGNAKATNDCIQNAVEKFRRQTCLQFRQQPTALDAISVVESGYCNYRDTNKTIHLGASCLNGDTCDRLFAQSISNERVYGNTIRHLNLKFNCTNKCSTDCKNGAKMTEDCKCECGYGFSGQTCEQLALRQEFTDASCGIVSNDKDGVLRLSTHPNAMPKATFCQWLIKANEQEIIEFEFVDLDLNYENAHPGQKCADNLLVLGVSEIENPIPCNKESRATLRRHYRSDGDWILFTLSTNTWSRAMHKGPMIKYQILSPQSNKEVRSFNKDYMNNDQSMFTRGFVTLALPLLLLKALL
ncbi:Astacin-like metalloendopeptidase [Aphelenchoides bicaudatus]|nr:Astacin-like metalloendopeptidase [Aphelenchoides bicaudatus]